MRSLIATTCIMIASATTLSAATYNVVGGFIGGQLGTVSIDVTITGDFSANISDTSSGLVINSLKSSVVGGDPFSVAGGLAFSYNTASDGFSLGGAAFAVFGVDPNTTDFLFSFSGLVNGPASGFLVVDSYSGLPNLGNPSEFFGGGQLAAIPLPAGFPFLLAGLASLVGLRMRKIRTSKV
jgi:hypothetical protein